MMFVAGLCSALLLCTGLASVLGQDSGDMPFNETLDSAGNVSLRWGFDSKQETITFQLACKTSGWVGFGLSPSGEMDGSDIVIGGVNPNGTTYFTDRHAVGDQLPLVDGSQDYTLLSLKEDATGTTMKFSRKVQTCDKDDMEISTSAMKLIYAYGADDSIAYHNNARGTKSVNLLQSTQRSTPSQDSVGQLEMTVNSFAVPERDTYYHCRIIKSPNFPGKRHVYRMEPKIQSGNVDLVHHILVYACPASVSVELEGECYSGQSMYVFSSCQQVVIGWAVGGQDIWMPPNAGISIGTSDDPVFYRLEMHYSNSKLSKGRVDSSGLVFHYTSELRANDVGILEVGLIVDTSYVIPPNAKDFKAYGLCNTSTFSQVLSGEPPVLNVFASLLHTHLAGRGVRVGHYRNGEQIGFLGKNEHYDFNLQETMFLGSLVQVKAGDEILVECTYNTESRKTATQGGLGTTNEMCLAFLLYYPRTKLASCWSLPEPTAMSAALGVKGTSELVALMNSSVWNDTAVGRFERTVRDLPQLMAVSVSNGTRIVDLSFIREFKSSPATACTTLPLSGGGESCALVTAGLGLYIALLTSLISLTGAL
ncbi:DBH-like monooxygenase protein 2 homolog [Acipenser ruthenus]|uniref:DBH-like monooxygenase protein 2 homolog n=1 Tax=Acipenser ruthenus TaxID=7906 RepID=UPI00274243D4|nr:DBH-like monooxygenase protein 2 homolog [Acipenser ruthenus]